jgi:hypothetical protein
VKGVDGTETLSDEVPVEPTISAESPEQNSELLRQIAEEMDRLGKSVADAADETADPDLAPASEPPDHDGTRLRAD